MKNEKLIKNSYNIEMVPIFKPKSTIKRSFKVIIFSFIFILGFSFWSSDPVNINYNALFNNEPMKLTIFAPTIVKANQKIEITVEAWDYCERLVCGYSKEVLFSSTDNEAKLPNNYKFSPSGLNQGFIQAQDMWFGDKGFQNFQVSFKTPGIHYINVSEVNGNLKGTSNPIIVFEENSNINTKLYWGDIHGHTARCDGSGWLSEVLGYAKDVAKCDFATVTLHDHFIQPIQGSFLWRTYWENTKDVLNFWNQKEDFVTLQAYEYRGEFLDTNSVGDMCVYTDGDDIMFAGGHLERFRTPDLLFNELRKWKEQTGNRILTIPHHPPHTLSGLTYDWSYYDPEFVRMVEIYSVHGNSEMKGIDGNRYPLIGENPPEIVEINKTGYYIQDALSMGFKVGFMASGDSHDGHVGHSISHTDANHLLQPPLSWGALPHLFRIHHHYPNGMTAVFSENLTRKDIFNSIYDRKCYAVKGTSRPFLNFTINENMIGNNNSTVNIDSETMERRINITAAVGGGYMNNIERILIYKNNKIWKNIICNNKTAVISYIDTEEITGMEYSIEKYGNLRNDGKYYINEIADNYIEPSKLNTNNSDVYYAKMYETQGGIAWAGPFWVL